MFLHQIIYKDKIQRAKVSNNNYLLGPKHSIDNEDVRLIHKPRQKPIHKRINHMYTLWFKKKFCLSFIFYRLHVLNRKRCHMQTIVWLCLCCFCWNLLCQRLTWSNCIHSKKQQQQQRDEFENCENTSLCQKWMKLNEQTMQYKNEKKKQNGKRRKMTKEEVEKITFTNGDDHFTLECLWVVWLLYNDSYELGQIRCVTNFMCE